VAVVDLNGERSQVLLAAAHLASVEHGLSTLLGHRLVILLPGDDPRAVGRVVASTLSAVAHDVTVGVAGPVTGPEETVRGHDEAARCVEALIALGRRGDVSTAADLGFVGLLLHSDMHVERYVTGQLGPVFDYDDERGSDLVHTLQEYFANGQRLAVTAAALQVHPNTVAQRLERVTRLLGPSWTEPERQLEVMLALRLARLRRRSRSSSR
jgi:DNA-binding PucR family transcriptional regulator